MITITVDKQVFHIAEKTNPERYEPGLSRQLAIRKPHDVYGLIWSLKDFYNTPPFDMDDDVKILIAQLELFDRDTVVHITL